MAHVVMDRCTTPNFTSAVLQKWSVLRSSTNVLKEPQNTVVKNAGRTIWVYCFPGYIVANNKNTSCPTSVFSLPSDTSFYTSDYAYKPLTTAINKTTALDVRLGAHFVHAPINNEIDLIRELEELRQSTDTLDRLTSIHFLNNGGIWKKIISSTPVVGTIILLTYCFYGKLKRKLFGNKKQEVKSVPLKVTKMETKENDSNITLEIDVDSIST